MVSVKKTDNKPKSALGKFLAKTLFASNFHIFFFTDVIIFCEPKKVPQEQRVFDFIAAIPMTEISNPEEVKGQANAFCFEGNGDRVVFTFVTIDQKVSWMNELLVLVRACHSLFAQ
jgi:hypothetical protein